MDDVTCVKSGIKFTLTNHNNVKQRLTVNKCQIQDKFKGFSVMSKDKTALQLLKIGTLSVEINSAMKMLKKEDSTIFLEFANGLTKS